MIIIVAVVNVVVDAVLVGVGTVVRDDPSLTVRRVAMPPNRPQPTRVVIDPTLRTPATSVLLTDGHPTIIVTDSAASAPEDLKRALARAPEVTEIVRVPRMPASEGAVEAAWVGGLELDKVLGVLGKLMGAAWNASDDSSCQIAESMGIWLCCPSPPGACLILALEDDVRLVGSRTPPLRAGRARVSSPRRLRLTQPQELFTFQPRGAWP